MNLMADNYVIKGNWVRQGLIFLSGVIVGGLLLLVFSSIFFPCFNVADDDKIVLAVEQVMPSMVQIISPAGDDILLQPDSDSGASGVIIDSKGLIVTSNHVIHGENYEVITEKGDRYPVESINIDPLNDLAFLKIKGDDLRSIDMGDYSDIRLGQQIITIGNVLGKYDNSVSTGVISGLNRSITTDKEQLNDLIQFDAPVSPGNSGGPLFDIDGHLVGINTAIDQDGNNIGFAVPVDQIEAAVRSLSKNNKIIRPRLGIKTLEYPENSVFISQIGCENGVLIYDDTDDGAVEPGGSADRAGLKKNDVIESVDQVKIGSKISLQSVIQRYNPGDEIEIKYCRTGKVDIVKVILDEMIE